MTRSAEGGGGRGGRPRAEALRADDGLDERQPAAIGRQATRPVERVAQQESAVEGDRTDLSSAREVDLGDLRRRAGAPDDELRDEHGAAVADDDAVGQLAQLLAG